MKRVLIIIIALFLFSSVYAYDINAGRQIGMGGTVVMSMPSAISLLSCPGASLAPGQYVIESGWQRRFELSDLDEISVLAAYRYNNITGVIGLSQMGTPDYYTEKIIRTEFIYHRDSFSFSLIGSGKMVEIGRDLGGLRAAAIGFGGSYHYKNYHFGLTLDNINKPKIAENLEGENMLASIFAEIDGGERHSVTGRLIFEKYEKPRVSIGQYINVTKRNAIFWGLSHNPLMYGGGIEVEYNSFSLTYAASYHPVLGFSHNVSISYAGGRKTSEEKNQP